MYHTFIALVDDKPGVLNRVVSLLRRLNYNVVSLTAGPCERPSVTRMTIVADASPDAAHRIRASMCKLRNVLRVDSIDGHACVTLELALIKIAADATSRERLLELARVFRADVIDLNPDALTLQITAAENKIEAFLKALRAHGIEALEILRSGPLAMRFGHEPVTS